MELHGDFFSPEVFSQILQAVYISDSLSDSVFYMYFSESLMCWMGNSSNFGNAAWWCNNVNDGPAGAEAGKNGIETHLNALPLIVQLHCPAF